MVGELQSLSLPFHLSLLPLSSYLCLDLAQSRRSICFVPGLGMGGLVGSKSNRYLLPLGHHLCWVAGLVRGFYTVKMQL